jgi:hypothetical protein
MPPIKTFITNKNIFLFGLFLVLVGMPLSKFLMSVGQFVLLGNWVIEGDWKRKWQVIRTSRVLWVIAAFYLLHLLGLLWTSDFDYALKDLRIKLPLLWFPLLFITSRPLEKKEIQGLLWFFTASVFIASIVCTLVWLGYTKHKVVDIRDISIFNSHIRFALMIDLAICFLLYNFFKTPKIWLYAIKVALVVWLVAFLGIMQSFTGIMILCAVMAYYAFLFLKNLRKPFLKVTAFGIIGLTVTFLVVLVIKEVKEQQVPAKPVKRLMMSQNKTWYFQDPENTETENGNLIWVNVCDPELQKEWEERSTIGYYDEDKKGNPMRLTIIRYLASKGLNKDSAALSKQTAADIALMENGTPNYLYTNKSGLENRIYELIYEYESYKKGNNPTGHSFQMRLEFWRVGLAIVKRTWLFGVGTGDVQRVYANQYKLSDSRLSEEWRKRSHNQFLAITIAFGCVGLIVFLFYLFFPVVVTRHKHYLFSGFFIIALLSMINEDTLETQAGVTFFGFFFNLLLFAESHEGRKDAAPEINEKKQVLSE